LNYGFVSDFLMHCDDFPCGYGLILIDETLNGCFLIFASDLNAVIHCPNDLNEQNHFDLNVESGL
jgi:hypothetical protein